ncbi:MAG: hypothetical protein ACK5V3_05610 [Bdellovibrionales bacterium]
MRLWIGLTSSGQRYHQISSTSELLIPFWNRDSEVNFTQMPLDFIWLSKSLALVLLIVFNIRSSTAMNLQGRKAQVKKSKVGKALIAIYILAVLAISANARASDILNFMF